MTTRPEAARQMPIMRFALLVSAALAAGAGLQLFVGTEQTSRYFAWTIEPPLTAAFLGAMYLGALALTAIAARQESWADARVSLFASICLVPLLFLVTLLHVDRFHTSSDETITLVGTWFFITTYAWLPLLLAAALVVQLRAGGSDPPRTAPLPRWMALVLGVHATAFSGLGLALLITPSTVDSLWPWALTPLTGRAAGAWLLSIGIAAAGGLRENDLRRVRVPFAAYVTLAICAGIAIARYPGTPDWSHPGAWAIMLVLATMLVTGVAGLVAERQLPGSRA